MAGKEIKFTPSEKNRVLQAAANQNAGSAVIADNRAASVLQRKQLAAFSRTGTVAQKKNSKDISSNGGIIQAKWTDKNGKEHEGNPPKGYVYYNTTHGQYWAPGSGAATGSKSDSDDDFVEDPDEFLAAMNEPDEKLRGKSGEYRKDRKFYSDKERDTRQNLVKRQSSTGGTLYSGFDGSGVKIPLDSQGREVRKHKTQGAKDRQPDIDHRKDWVAIDDAVERYQADSQETDMSEAELETFKDFLYNDEDNLEILAHSEHKQKKKTSREQLSEGKKKEMFKYVKDKRPDYKKEKYAQKKRDQKRQRLDKKRKRDDSASGPNKKQKKEDKSAKKKK
jgi:hypothetical protein